MKVLKGQDILALGFMTFALFVGAGNIIFPPIVGLQAGPNVWWLVLLAVIAVVGCVATEYQIIHPGVFTDTL